MQRALYAVGLAILACPLSVADSHAVRVSTVRVPDAGIQPQLAVDTDGTIHMIYYKGDAAAGDLFYVQSTDAGATFSPAIRVNSQDQSAVAAGTIRGAHLSLGKNGRVHVAWNGSEKAKPKGPANPDLPANSPYRHSAPMLYSRMNDEGTGFQPERNLMTHTYSLDGGGSVAADGLGNVYVVWHANSLNEDARGEGGRAVWVATSRDEGKTFAPESRANREQTGACGCCGLRAHADARGNVYILYRSAENTVNRDMYELASNDKGITYEARKLDQWEVARCVMSSACLSGTTESTFAAWETEFQVKFARIDNLAPGSTPTMVVPESNTGIRKHPVVAANSQGQVILVWTEGTGWQKGGDVAWQVFDKLGKPVAGGFGQAKGVPVWSFAAVYSRPDGGFTVVY